MKQNETAIFQCCFLSLFKYCRHFLHEQFINFRLSIVASVANGVGGKEHGVRHGKDKKDRMLTQICPTRFKMLKPTCKNFSVFGEIAEKVSYSSDFSSHFALHLKKRI